jgi:hypothetical protein
VSPLGATDGNPGPGYDEQMYVIQTSVRYTRTPGRAPIPSSPLGRGPRRRRSDAHPLSEALRLRRRHGDAAIQSGDRLRPRRGLPPCPSRPLQNDHPN